MAHRTGPKFMKKFEVRGSLLASHADAR